MPSVGVSCAVFLCLCHIFAVLRYLGLSFAFMCYFDMFLALYLLPWAAIGCPGLSWAVSGSVLSWALRCIGLSCAVAGFLAVLGWHMLSWAGMGCPGLSWALLGLSCALMSSVCCLCFSFGVGAACVVSVCI